MTAVAPSATVLRHLALCLRLRAPRPCFRLSHASLREQVPGPRSLPTCLVHPSNRAYTTTASVQLPLVEMDGDGIITIKDPIEEAYVLDEKIPAASVRRRHGSGLDPAQPLESLLRSIDRKNEVVRLIKIPDGGDPAIVEVHTREGLLQILKEKQAHDEALKKKGKKLKPKQVELNWAVSEHDFAMKMRQLRQFIEKGKKVELLIAAKKRQRRASPEEAEEVMKKIRKTIQEIEDCKELRPMDGHVGGQVLMTIGKIQR